MRKALSLIICLCICLSVVVIVNAPTEAVAASRGDINGDKSINIRDALVSFRYVAGLCDDFGTYEYVSADVDADGTVSVGDSLLTFKKVAGLEAGLSDMPKFLSDPRLHIFTASETYMREEELKDTGKDTVKIQVANNEYECGQIILRSERTMNNVSLSIGELRSAGGDVIPADNIELYKDYYIYCEVQSPNYPIAGWYPDALIPLSFDDLNSITVNANENQGYWIVLNTLDGQAAGVYTGEITVEFEGGIMTVPVEVEVWDFAIPTKPSFGTAYGLQYYHIWEYFENNGMISKYNMTKDDVFMEYYNHLLDYRINAIHSPVSYLYSFADFPSKQKELMESDERIVSYLIPMYSLNTTLVDLLEQEGILQNGYTYIFDEPGDDPNVNEKIADILVPIQNYNSSVKNLITTAPRESLRGVVNNWCGIWSAGSLEEVSVREWQNDGDSVWWYGCIGPQAPYPSYHIMGELMSSRLVHWMQEDWNIEGNLYWTTSLLFKKYIPENDAYSTRDFWTDPYAFPQTAGDGSLFYLGVDGDGVVNRVAFIPTLRLMSIRDGSEDIEYLVLMEKKLGALLEKWGITDISVDTIMDTYYAPLYNTMGDYDTDPALMYKTRERLAHDIMAADDAICCVLPYLTAENADMREARVYAESGSSVVIDCVEASENNCGAYSIYSKVFDMSKDDFTTIDIVINGDTYTRTLKSIEEYEYIEIAYDEIVNDVKSLGLDINTKTYRETYKTDTFDIVKKADISGLDGQLAGGAVAANAKVVEHISKNEDYVKSVISVISAEFRNDIPLVMLHEQIGTTNENCFDEDITVYVPSGATVTYKGEEMTRVKTTDTYSEYTVTDTFVVGRNFCDFTVSYNGVTETYTRVIKHTVGLISQLTDFDNADCNEVINGCRDASVVDTEDGKGIKIDGVRVTIPSSAFISDISDISGFTHLRITIKNTSASACNAPEMFFKSAVASEGCRNIGKLEPGEKVTVDLNIPESMMSQLVNGLRILNKNGGDEPESFIIYDLKLVTITTTEE